MWYLRWERERVTRIHCYIFSQIFLLTTFFTGTHKDKAIGLQQGKSLTQNKDSSLKTEWASKGTQKQDQNCNDQNAWTGLCHCPPGVNPRHIQLHCPQRRPSQVWLPGGWQEVCSFYTRGICFSAFLWALVRKHTFGCSLLKTIAISLKFYFPMVIWIRLSK